MADDPRRTKEMQMNTPTTADREMRWAVEASYSYCLITLRETDDAMERVVGRDRDYSGADVSGSSAARRDLGWWCESRREADGLAAKLRAAFPHLEVRVHDHGDG